MIVGAPLSLAEFGHARDFSLPAEYETLGIQGSAYSNSGVAGLQGPDAVRVNPALLVLDREYSFSAAYNWVERGRDFYQLGVVDGTTSQMAAGVLFTGMRDSYEAGSLIPERDSPVIKRASLGVAYPFSRLALGLAGHYVEGIEESGLSDRVVKGVSLGVGAVAFLTPSLRMGLAIENLNNDKTERFSPQTLRAGLYWNVFPEQWQIFVDYRQRQRLAELEGPIDPIPGVAVDPSELKGFTETEKMLLAGFDIRVYNILKIVTSYGHAVSNDGRRSLAASIGIDQQGFGLNYTVARPYLDRDEMVSSLSLTILLKI
jgi:hypothetical protein